jgi:hypothetical protein
MFNKSHMNPAETAMTKVLMQRVLSAYVRVGVIGIACDEAGVRRSTHRQWLENFPKYKELFEELQEKFTDGLEKVAIDRAKEKSDPLLAMLLKANRRDKYGDKAELDHKNLNSPITLVFSEGMLNDDEKKLLEDASQKAREELDDDA